MQTIQPKPRSTTGLWITIAVLSIAVLISFLMVFIMAVSSFSKKAAGGHVRHGLEDAPVDEEPNLTEVWSWGYGEAKVARIAVDGVIMRGSEGGFFDVPVDKIERILAEIRAAQNDADVVGIILEVDSPGGGVTPSDEIYDALKKFKDSDNDRKVVVLMRDLAASGGYYVSMAGDCLIAQPTAIVGSIGVIMQSMNLKGLGDKVGVRDVTIKSGKNKDLLNPFGEVDTNHIAVLQAMIDTTYERFFRIVKENRPIDEKKLRELADGRVFDASDALKLKLVDQLGYWEDAIKKMAELLGEEDIKVIRYETRVSVFDRLLNAKTPVAVDLKALQEAGRPKMQFLWQP